jgi:hypothetical protein
MNSEKIWFLHDSTERAGPMTLDEAADRLLKTNSQFHAWRNGMNEWMPAKDIEELQQALAGKTTPSRGSPPMMDSEPAIRLESFSATPPPTPRGLDIEIDHSREQKKRPSPSKTLLTRFVLILGVAGIGGAGYLYWPQITSPQGLINRWLTRLPEIPDLPADQKNLLQAAASSGSSDPTSAPVEIVMIPSTSAAQTPAFYLAANLPDGAELTIDLKPDPAAITGNISGTLRTSAVIQHRLARTETVHTGDGSVLPRGVYQVTVTDPDHRTRTSRQLFIGSATSGSAGVGAERDAKFNQELAQYQRSVLTQAQAEVSDLKNIALKLAAIETGEDTVSKSVKKSRTAAARAKAKADWEKQRLTLVDEIQKLFQPPAHFFATTRNVALALQDAIEDWRTHQDSTNPANSDESRKKIEALKSDLSARLDAADKRIETASGYFAPE